VELSGVPETLLWTLYHRASEAARPDAVIDDPRAVELVEAIDYPFAERFGPVGAAQAQWQALRARTFDDAVRRFAREHPGGTVVALGEGLETGFWRVDDGRLRWLTVDLPETVAVRERLLPDDPGDPRRRTLAGSALDPSWMDEVDPARGVLITAQGLFMYLRPAEVRGLIDACAERFPGAALVFDTAPRWFTELAKRGLLRTPNGYVAPPMPWGMDLLERRRIAHRPGVSSLRELHLPRGRGRLFGLGYPAFERLPLLRDLSLVVLEARFAPDMTG
jgi:O-methyltransferase involved in polyketide biosynthesis